MIYCKKRKIRGEDMEYRRFDIQGNDADTLYTEILYALAVARTEGESLVRLVITPEEDADAGKLSLAAARHLRRLKKEKKIGVFVLSAELSSDSTEAAYLLNKYPSLDKEGTEPLAVADVYIKL